MEGTRIPSPARSHGVATPRRYKPLKKTRSIASPARTPSRLTAILQNPFQPSPIPERWSILDDDTNVTLSNPPCKNWWKNLGENSVNMKEVFQNKDTTNNGIDDFSVATQCHENKLLLENIDSSDESEISLPISPKKPFHVRKPENFKKIDKFTHSAMSEGDSESENISTRRLFKKPVLIKTKPLLRPSLINRVFGDNSSNTSSDLDIPVSKRHPFFNIEKLQTKKVHVVVADDDEDDNVDNVQAKAFALKRQSIPVPGCTGTRMSMASSIAEDEWNFLPSSTRLEINTEEESSPKRKKRNTTTNTFKSCINNQNKSTQYDLNHTRINIHDIEVEDEDEKIDAKSNDEIDQEYNCENPLQENTLIEQQNDSAKEPTNSGESLFDNQNKNTRDLQCSQSNIVDIEGMDKDEINGPKTNENIDEENNCGNVLHENTLIEQHNETEKHAANNLKSPSYNQNHNTQDLNCSPLNNHDTEVNQDEKIVATNNRTEDEHNSENPLDENTVIEQQNETAKELTFEDVLQSDNESEVQLDYDSESNADNATNEENSHCNQDSRDHKEETNVETETIQAQLIQSQHVSKEPLIQDCGNDVEIVETQIVQSSHNAQENGQNLDGNERENDENILFNPKNSNNIDEERSIEKESIQEQEIENASNEPPVQVSGNDEEDIETENKQSRHTIQENDGNEQESDENCNESTPCNQDSSDHTEEINIETERIQEQETQHASKESLIQDSGNAVEENETENEETSHEIQENGDNEQTSQENDVNEQTSPENDDNEQTSQENDDNEQTSQENGENDQESDENDSDHFADIEMAEPCEATNDTTKDTTNESQNKENSHRIRQQIIEESSDSDDNDSDNYVEIEMVLRNPLNDNGEISKMPQANSTEYPNESIITRAIGENVIRQSHFNTSTKKSNEEILQQIREEREEKWRLIDKEVEKLLKAGPSTERNYFKIPAKPRIKKANNNKPANKVKTNSENKRFALPEEFYQDLKYKPPKRYQPKNAAWATKRLYSFLETKLEPKYDYKARVRAEKLVESIYIFTQDIRKLEVAPPNAISALKYEMARLNVVQTHFDFYDFIKTYLPRDVRLKVVPSIVNKIEMPKPSVFSNIIP